MNTWARHCILSILKANSNQYFPWTDPSFKYYLNNIIHKDNFISQEM